MVYKNFNHTFQNSLLKRTIMAGGGIAGAIVALKNNRAMLKRRKLKSKEEVYGKEGTTLLNLKESTDQDMRRIRKKIKEYKRQEQRAWMISLLITAFLCYCFIWWMGIL